MGKAIPFNLIVKIQHRSMDIFEYEDDDLPNYRGMKACEKAIDKYLSEITSDEEEQLKIYEVITS